MEAVQKILTESSAVRNKKWDHFLENFVRLGVHGTIVSVRKFRRLAVKKFERANRGQIIWPVRSKT